MKQSLTAVDFCFCAANMTADVRPSPTVPVNIVGMNGIAYIDTCAKSSIASYQLYNLLERNGVSFEKEVMYVTLDDGVPKKRNVLRLRTLYGGAIMTSFVVFPDARTNRTLLGVGFIEYAMLALNLPQPTCSFVDEPRKESNLIYYNWFMSDLIYLQDPVINNLSVSIATEYFLTILIRKSSFFC
ncbi:hypothetical protein B5X24_HaOG216053 [Helicoverpa armigera]|uniref:Uncharacterized protein n=1 Tax=Helicoverpa armigera TaxID=29058 RepID=A0A2W1B4L9_HELAM|nr:hypothetical protein B5X24_HaOG216053 [Helicoverpa armigera]